jgi:hypothetical protein
MFTTIAILSALCASQISALAKEDSTVSFVDMGVIVSENSVSISLLNSSQNNVQIGPFFYGKDLSDILLVSDETKSTKPSSYSIYPSAEETTAWSKFRSLRPNEFAGVIVPISFFEIEENSCRTVAFSYQYAREGKVTKSRTEVVRKICFKRPKENGT